MDSFRDEPDMSGVAQLMIGAGSSARDGNLWYDNKAALYAAMPGGSPSNARITVVAKSPSTFFVHGQNGAGTRMGATSSDGVSWTNVPYSTYAMYHLAWTDTVFIADLPVGTGNNVLTSPDGVTWTTRAVTGFGDTGSNTQKTFASNGSRIVILGEQGRTAASTNGGVSWTVSSSLATLGGWSFVTYASYVFWTGTKFLAFGDNREVAQSTDGITWYTSTSLPNISYFNTANIELMAKSSTGRVAVMYYDLGAYTDDEGVTWNDFTPAFRAAFPVGGADGLVFNGSYFVATNGINSARSADGITWVACTPVSPAFHALNMCPTGLIWDGKKMLAFEGPYTSGLGLVISI